MIINARGEEEPFELRRVVASILNAIRLAEYRDESEADHIAPVVEYALSRYFGDKPPSAEDVAHYIEQALRSLPGLGDVADAYIRARQRRRSLDQIEAGEGTYETHDGPVVASRSDYSLHGWDRARLEAALVREHALSLPKAQEIAGVVEMQVRGLALDEVSTSLLRELIDAQLSKHGVLAADLGIGQLSLPAWDIEQAIFPQEDTPSESSLDTPQELERFVGKAVMRQFTWRKIHDASVREACLEGRMAIADSGQPQRFRRITLDVASLLKEGAGFGDSPFFVGGVTDVFEALERVLQITTIACAQVANEVVLRSLDSAFGPLIRSKADLARLCRALRTRLGAIDPSIRIIVGFDALAGRMDLPGSISLLDAWLRDLIDDMQASRQRLETRLSIGEASVDDPSALATLGFALDAALLGRSITFEIDRPRRSQRRRELFGEASRDAAPNELVSAHGLLNLVGPLLVDGKREESAILEDLGRRLRELIDGLADRDAFVRRFHGRRRSGFPSPTALLGRTWAQSASSVEVGVVGLHEYATHISGAAPESDAYASALDRLLGFLTLRLNECAEEAGLEARLVGACDDAALHGMVNTLRRSFADRYEKLLASLSRDLSVGPALPAWLNVEAKTLLEVEGRLHGVFKDGVALLRHEQSRLSREQLVTLLVSLVSSRDAKVRALRYQVSMRQCSRCAIMARPEVRVCPSCGSREWRIPHGQKVLFADADDQES